MNAIDFCYWLQGHFELNPDQVELNSEQVRVIKNHLRLTFAHHIDPLRNSESNLTPEKSQRIHDGKLDNHSLERDIRQFICASVIKNPNTK